MHHTEPLIFPCRRRDAVQSRSAPIFKYHPSPPPFVTRFLFRSYPLLSSPSPRGGRRKNGRKKRRSFARLISNERHTLSLSLLPFAYANYRSRDLTFLTGEKNGRGGRTLGRSARVSRRGRSSRVPASTIFLPSRMIERRAESFFFFCSSGKIKRKLRGRVVVVIEERCDRNRRICGCRRIA